MKNSPADGWGVYLGGVWYAVRAFVSVSAFDTRALGWGSVRVRAHKLELYFSRNHHHEHNQRTNEPTNLRDHNTS